MVEVVLKLRKGSEYIADLARRMDREGISQNALARELEKNPSQVSRWFTPNEVRRVTPDLDTVLEIERAVNRIAQRKSR